MQFKWIPPRSVGSAEVGTNNSDLENAGAELKRLNRRLEALEEKEAVDGREHNRKNISRISVKVPKVNRSRRISGVEEKPILVE